LLLGQIAAWIFRNQLTASVPELAGAALWTPGAAGGAIGFVWYVVLRVDQHRFRKDARIGRHLAAGVPRGLRLCGLEAPMRKVRRPDGSVQHLPGEPFRVRLVKRTVASQRLTGLFVKVPMGLPLHSVTVDLMRDAAQSVNCPLAEYVLYAETRGDKGRWRFFHLLAFQMEDITGDSEASAGWTGDLRR
jgi:hypothetical protein